MWGRTWSKGRDGGGGHEAKEEGAANHHVVVVIVVAAISSVDLCFRECWWYTASNCGVDGVMSSLNFLPVGLVSDAWRGGGGVASQLRCLSRFLMEELVPTKCRAGSAFNFAKIQKYPPLDRF